MNVKDGLPPSFICWKRHEIHALRRRRYVTKEIRESGIFSDKE